MFRGSVKSTGYPLPSPVAPSLPLLASPCAITFQLDSTTLTPVRIGDESYSLQPCFQFQYADRVVVVSKEPSAPGVSTFFDENPQRLL